MAPAGQSGQLRLARRLRSHPHLVEIERAVPGVRVDSFAPMISYGQPRGILAVVSGRIGRGTPDPAGLEQGATALDVASVVGTSRVRIRLSLGSGEGERPFTVGVALDNLTFPAANAVRLAQAILGRSEARSGG